MRGTAAASHGPSGPSTITGIAIGGAGLIDPLPPLRDDDYLTFAKFLNSSGSVDRISLHKFKRGLLKYGIVYREEDAVTICLELNPSGGDVLVSAIRNKISNRDPKLCNLLKKYIRTVLENQPGSTRDRVLGKIISRAGETMTPEINLLRSSVSTYKYIESDAALLDIKDEVIEVVPVRSNIAAVEPNPSSASQRSSYLPETPPSRTSIHLPPHSSSRDRILGKIISNAVSTVSLDKSAHEDQPQPQELTPRAAPHHSSRDKVLAKIISTAVSAAGGGSNSNGGDSCYYLSGEPCSSRLPVAEGKSSTGYAPLRGEDSKSSSFFPSSAVNSLLNLPTGGSGQDEGDCALQDYNDDLSVTRRSFAPSQRTKNQTPQSPQESKGNCSSQRNSSGHDNGSGGNSSSESKRRVTYDPEKHSSLYSNPSNEFFQMDMMETAIDNRHILDRTLSRESNRPRRHSENSICEDPEVLEQMKSVRAKDLDSRSQSKNLRTAVGYGAATGGGRVRNKILNRMVNRVKETVLPFSSSSEPNKHPNRPLSGQSPQQPQREGHESPLKLKDKALSPTRDGTGSGRWFQHGGKFSATVAIDNFAAPPASPASASSPRLCIQTMESRADGDISASASGHPGDLQQHSSREDRGSGSGRPRITSESPNPLRHILSDARLAIPSTSGSPQGSSSFSPGRGKASPLQLNVSTPQPYRETYRRTLHPHHTHSPPEDRAFTPEPEAELLEDREERSSGWKSSDGNQTPGQRDRWVGAAPVQGGSGEHRSRQQQSSNRDSSGSSSRR